MISRQKARRIAYGIIVSTLEESVGEEPNPSWTDEERGAIRDELKRIKDDLKKKSQ